MNIYKFGHQVSENKNSDFSVEEQQALDATRRYLDSLKGFTGFTIAMMAIKPDANDRQGLNSLNNIFSPKFNLYISHALDDPREKNVANLTRTVEDFTKILDDSEMINLLKENSAYAISQISKDFIKAFDKYEATKSFAMALEASLTVKNDEPTMTKAEQARPRRIKI
jgi:hypothetical protein